MPYTDAAVINVSGLTKSRVKALASKRGQSENAVLEYLLDGAETGLDKPEEIPSLLNEHEASTDTANDKGPRDHAQLPCQIRAGPSSPPPIPRGACTPEILHEINFFLGGSRRRHG